MMRSIYHDGDPAPRITEAQRDLHNRVVELVALRRPVPTLGRMIPYDERLYTKIAEHDAGEALQATRNALATCLLVDVPYLSPDTVDRLVSGVLRAPSVPASEDSVMIAALGLNHPHLLSRHPWLRDAVIGNGQLLLLYEIALTCREKDPAGIDPIIGLLGERISSFRGPVIEMGMKTASMVRRLRGAGIAMSAVLDELAEFGALAWSQVTPQDLLVAVDLEQVSPSRVAVLLTSCLQSTTWNPDDPEAAAAVLRLREIAEEGLRRTDREVS
jgi:hypothetical protein